MPDIVLPEAAQDFLLELVEKGVNQPMTDEIKKQLDDSAVMCRKVGFALSLCAIPKYITAYKKENGNESPNTVRLSEFMFNLIQSYKGDISNCDSPEFDALCQKAWEHLI